MGREDQHLLSGIPRHINGRHAFVHERVLLMVVRETLLSGSIKFRKRDLAVQLGCCDAMLDRALARLRRSGDITSTPSYSETGSQLANSYSATEQGVEEAQKLIAAIQSVDPTFELA